jgi:hypothetical protein
MSGTDDIRERAMTSSKKGKDLLSVLRRLYAKIMMRYIHSHDGAHHGPVAAPPDIVSPLSRCIDNLAAARADAVQTVAAMGDQAPPANGAPGAGKGAEVSSPTPAAGKGFGELSEYFRANHTHSPYYPDAGRRLVQSTWDHTYAAIRAARAGDVKIARLHAELANSAFKEVAHYMSGQAYTDFVADVIRVLNEFNGQLGPANSN